MTSTNIAIAGASGFIGQALCRALAPTCSIRALTRSPLRAATPDPDPRIQWRHCDLFSEHEIRAGLSGCDMAIYLVHSLAPSSRLTQAAARDLDLIMADNFARAAAAVGVRQILFISSLMPSGYRIAPLLWSRYELELALASQGTPLTTLRAALVVGPGGSAPKLLVDLVRRLPLLALPSKARSITRPIALADLARAVRLVVESPERYRGTFDLGGPDALSYSDMVRQSAEALRLRRLVFILPGLPLWLVSLVARTVSGAPSALVGPIVASLPQDIAPRDNPLQVAILPDALTFREALNEALEPGGRHLGPSPRQIIGARERERLRKASRVRSIQRIIQPPGQSAAWVAGNYFRWLGRCCWPLIGTRIDAAGRCEVWLLHSRLRLLSLERSPAECTPEREVYRIRGGLLCRARGGEKARFEFQSVLGGRYVMAAIHDYAPALPWPLYRWTQAVIHLLVMRRYQRLLARLAR